MKKILTCLLSVAVLAICCTLFSGCMRQDYLIFEDGEFDGVEFSDYDLMHNAELEMDDTDRD